MTDLSFSTIIRSNFYPVCILECLSPRQGLGANFIVEWVAQTEISEPTVEAVMLGTDLHQGISLISPGRVIKSHNNRQRSSSVPGSVK